MAEILLYDYQSYEYDDYYGYSEITNVIGMGNLSAGNIVPQIESFTGQHLIVRIASIGGRVLDGICIYNALVKHGNVTVINDGFCMSIAAMIAMAGSVRETFSSSIFMVHKASAFVLGGMNADDMRKEADSLDIADNIMIAAFSKATGISEAKLQGLLSDQTFYTGFDAYQMGFFTTLIDGETQAIAQSSYDKITAKAPFKMVALMDKALKIKENKNMSTHTELLTEIKAQREETKGFFATFLTEVKAAFTGKAPEAATAVETKPVVEKTELEKLQEELETTKAELAAEKEKVATTEKETSEVLSEAKTYLAEAKIFMATAKQELQDTRSNYTPPAAKKEFTQSTDAQASGDEPKFSIKKKK